MRKRKITPTALKRACECGNATACSMTLTIFGAAHLTFSDVDVEDPEHPNKMPFVGTLLILDAPSTKPPHGSHGHRIFVPKAVAQKRLDGLVGMGLNYAPDLEGHAPRRKVGVITEAWIDGDKVKVKGVVYKKDFPEVERDFKQGRLGMSMELANVYVRDEHEEVWYLEDFHFTGATVLKKEAAAYYQTALAAKAEGARSKGAKMAKPKEKERTAKASVSQKDQLVDALVSAVRQGLAPVTQEIQGAAAGIANLRAEVEDMKQLYQISAAARREEDDEEMSAARREEDDEEMAAGNDEEDDEEMSAAKSKSDDDEDDDSSDSSDDDNDDDDLDAMEDLEKKAADPEPGEFNDDAKNKGSKNSVTNPPRQGDSQFSNSVASKRLSSAAKPFPGLKSAAGIQAAAYIGDLKAQVGKLKKQLQAQAVESKKTKMQLKKMRNRYEAMEAQVARYADNEDRRSAISVDLANLAAKSNIDLYEMRASGSKFSVEQVDQIFSNSGLNLDATQRMALKNKFMESGLMEHGEVRRLGPGSTWPVQ